MSRVYFHSEHGTAELRGSERAWLDHVARGPAQVAWNLDRYDALERCERIIQMIPEPPAGEYGANYLHASLRAAQEQRTSGKWRDGYGAERHLFNSVLTALNGSGVPLHVAGHVLRSADVGYNTALAAGSDVIALAAKIHGSCESHGWVDGPDRAWLADLIDDGLRYGIYRAGVWYQPATDAEREWHPQGWEDVIALLREANYGPVVVSDSSGYRFPNAQFTDLDDEAFEDLADGEQWTLAMNRLRAEKSWARIGPDTLRSVTFGPSVTVYDLLAPDRDERVRAAFAAEGATDD